MLTDDADRAAAIAAELDRANAERRWAEQKVVEGAERARAALPAELADAPALVLSGEGWHPGVVGIAASRMVERHFRPTILLSVDGVRAKGSARSIPGFDLVAALDATAEHLNRYGGHRAAAGLELEADRSRRLPGGVHRPCGGEHRPRGPGPHGAPRRPRRSRPRRDRHGPRAPARDPRPVRYGEPGPRLLVPSGRLREVRPLGEEGKHSRFQLESGAGRAVGVAFGMNGEITRREDQALDLSSSSRSTAGTAPSSRAWSSASSTRWSGPRPNRTAAPAATVAPPRTRSGGSRLGHELARVAEGRPGALLDVRAAQAAQREVVDRRGGAAVASLAELISSGESVLAICADAARRAKLASSAADPRRFGAALPRIACCRCGADVAGCDPARGARREPRAGRLDGGRATPAGAAPLPPRGGGRSRSERGTRDCLAARTA